MGAGREANSQNNAQEPHGSDISGSLERMPTHNKLGDGKWLHVLSGFAVFLNTWGLLLSFGGFQAYYQESLLSRKSELDLSWISSFCAFVLLGGGVITGPLYDAGYLRYLLLGGILLQVVGLITTSLATHYYQIFLAQGLCVGLGGSLVYVPSIAAVAAEFDAKTRPKVMGIIASGTGVGGVIYPIMFRKLLPSVGFAWTVRSIAFLVLGIYVLVGGVMLSRSKRPTAIRTWIDFSTLTEGPSACLLLAAFFSGAAYYIPLLYLPRFTGLTIMHQGDSQLSFYILSIVNGVSIIGMLLAGPIAAYIGPFETATIALTGCAVVLFAWIPVFTITGVIIWAVFWGLISSVIVALPAALVPLLTPSLSLIGTRLGMYWICVGAGVLVGSPIGGLLVGNSTISPVWWHIQVFAGLLMAASVLLFVYPTAIIHRRNRPTMIK